MKRLPNLRDLGGIALSGGRILRRGLILRSDALHRLTDEDCTFLMAEYSIATIIDLRTDLEVAEKPDVIPNGVEYVHIPVFKEAVIGITKETGSDPGAYIKRTWNRAAIRAALPDMVSVYSGVLADDYSVEQIGRTIHIVIRNVLAGRTTLFHCSQGKDRTGAVAALILLLLGADRKTVVRDYVDGGRIYNGKALKDAVLMTLFKWDPAGGFIAFHADRAEPRFILAAFRTIDERWGSPEAMFREAMGISDSVREQFLEKISA